MKEEEIQTDLRDRENKTTIPSKPMRKDISAVGVSRKPPQSPQGIIPLPVGDHLGHCHQGRGDDSDPTFKTLSSGSPELTRVPREEHPPPKHLMHDLCPLHSNHAANRKTLCPGQTPRAAQTSLQRQVSPVPPRRPTGGLQSPRSRGTTFLPGLLPSRRDPAPTARATPASLR